MFGPNCDTANIEEDLKGIWLLGARYLGLITVIAALIHFAG